MYRIILLPQAKRTYVRLARRDARTFLRIDAALQELSKDPHQGKCLAGRLKGKLSFRVGAYRIIYSVEKQKLIVYVLDIGHRREIYQ